MKKIVFLIASMILLALAGCGQLQIGGVATQVEPTLATPLVTDGGVVVSEGTIVPRDFTRVYSRTGGEVAEVQVEKGQWVEEGAVLVRFADREQAEAALTAARLAQVSAQQDLDRLNEKAQLVSSSAGEEVSAAFRALTEAQQALDDLDTDQYQTDLDNARTDVTTAQDELDDAQDEWDKRKDLDADNTTRKNAETRLDDAQRKYDNAVRERDRVINQMDQAKAAVNLAQARYDDAQAEAEKSQGGSPRPEDLKLAQASLDNATAQVAAAERALENLELRAPFAGTVIELDVAKGEIVLPSQMVLLLADDSAWYVETTDLTELDVVKVSVGQEAQVSPDALPDLELAAQVEEIARSAGRKGGDVVYTTRLRLTESDPLLRWGMTVEVRFDQ